MNGVGRRVQRFQVVAHLGSGGVGTVLRAHDPQLERDVAIKLLNTPRGSVPELSTKHTLDLRTDSPTKSDGLLREARMMARLSHPNVLPVYEVGLADDTVFVVMEHIDGADLRAWLPGKRRRAILDVMTQAARGLVAAHAQQIVHGDFKPENVLIGRDGRVRVGDFGLARLRDSSPAMRRVDHVSGTPRYMAPELWVGGAVSQASDVYAFCMTLAEALGAKLDDVAGTLRAPRALRAAILAGTADNRAHRPPLDQILAVLERRPSQKQWLVGAAAALLVGGSGVAFVLLPSSEDSCSVDRSVARAWDVARDTAMRGTLRADRPSEKDREWIARISGELSRIHAEVGERWIATCRAERAGRLTAQQADESRSCLTRRALEVEARLDHFTGAKLDTLGPAVERARILEATECDEMTAPAMLADRMAVKALHRRLADIELLSNPDRIEPALAVMRDAAALGERELEIRATASAGVYSLDASKHEPADALFKTAYQAAVDMHSTRLQLLALGNRVRLELRRGNNLEAMSLGKVALALADKGGASALARARTYMEVSRAFDRTDPKVTLELHDKGLAVVAQDGHRLPYTEANLRIGRARALGGFEGNHKAALAAANETLAWIEQTHGKVSIQTAMGLELLAQIQAWAADPRDALKTMEAAAAMREATMPKNDPSLWLTKGDLARHYEMNDRHEEARKIYEAELAEAPRNELIRGFIPLLTVRLGTNTCAVGRCDEGYPMIERGVELGIAQYGDDHPFVLEYRGSLLVVQLDHRKLAEADKNIAALHRGHSKRAPASAGSLIWLTGQTARLAMFRGDGKRAEQLVREALAKAVELGHLQANEGSLKATLVDTLIAQRKWQEAQVAYDDLVAVIKRRKLPETVLIGVSTRLAQIEAGTGEHERARERAQRALTQLPVSAIEARRRAQSVIDGK